MRSLTKLATKFRSSACGLAMIEFALILPLLLLLFGGVIEMTRYVLAHQKVDKAANSLADFLGQQNAPGDFPLATLDAAFDKLINPFDSGSAGYIVTGVTLNNQAVPTITWQHSRGAVQPSKVGSGTGQTADISDIILRGNEQLVVAEVFYSHATILDNIGAISQSLNFDGKQLYKQALTIQRVPTIVRQGSPQPMTAMYGCCGQYCEEGDITDPDDTDWLPACACMRFNICNFAPSDSRYNLPIGEQRRLWINHYGCRSTTTCPPLAPPDPCVAAGNCPPDPPCNSCACDTSLCNQGGV